MKQLSVRLDRARRSQSPSINTTGVFLLRNIERVTIHNGASSYGARRYSHQISAHTSCDMSRAEVSCMSLALRSRTCIAARSSSEQCWTRCRCTSFLLPPVPCCPIVSGQCHGRPQLERAKSRARDLHGARHLPSHGGDDSVAHSRVALRYAGVSRTAGQTLRFNMQHWSAARCKTPRSTRGGCVTQRLRRLRAMRRFTAATSLSSTTQPRHDGVPHRHGIAESAGQP
jgi:hypothetical protein